MIDYTLDIIFTIRRRVQIISDEYKTREIQTNFRVRLNAGRIATRNEPERRDSRARAYVGL